MLGKSGSRTCRKNNTYIPFCHMNISDNSGSNIFEHVSHWIWLKSKDSSLSLYNSGILKKWVTNIYKSAFIKSLISLIVF